MQIAARDLTKGSIYQNLLLFAAPFLLANFIQALYGTVDMIVVGWFTDAAGITAVSIGSQIMVLVNSMVTGITMGGTILIAQYMGAGQEHEISRTIGTMFTLFFLIGLALTVLLFGGASPLLIALQTPTEAFPDTMAYTRIAACGVIFTLLYNGVSAILRGMGDSVRPLLFISVACVCNVLLDLLFVGVFHWGPGGAAAATILSQALSMVLSILYLRRRDFVFDFKLQSFRLSGSKARKIIRLGLPISLQSTMVDISFLIIAAVVNTFGVTAAAAVGIAEKFNSFAMLPASALSGAIASMVGQNIGSGQPERARKVLRIGIVFSLIGALGFFLWVQLSPESVMLLFKADREVIGAGLDYIRAFSFDFLLVAFVFCMNGFYNGCGCTVFSMVNGLLATFLVRIPLVFLLGNMLGMFGVGLAAPLASFASIVLGYWYLSTGRWKQQGLISPEAAPAT